jgi:hypothetical protein
MKSVRSRRAERVRSRANETFEFFKKKQGAAGITTAAPHIAGQWGRGDDRLPR